MVGAFGYKDIVVLVSCKIALARCMCADILYVAHNYWSASAPRGSCDLVSGRQGAFPARAAADSLRFRVKVAQRGEALAMVLRLASFRAHLSDDEWKGGVKFKEAVLQSVKTPRVLNFCVIDVVIDVRAPH